MWADGISAHVESDEMMEGHFTVGRVEIDDLRAKADEFRRVLAMKESGMYHKWEFWITCMLICAWKR